MLNNKPYAVLFCDDDKGIGHINKLIVKNRYRNVAGHSREEIIDLICEANPGIILLDLLLPVLKGDEIVRELKNNEATKHIPVVLFSASGNIENIAKSIGADGFLQKPYKSSEKESLVQKLLFRYSPKASFS
jgi:CheY-like chemotaxis protein